MSELNEILKAWRHELHRHPETAFEETRTAAFVAERLREMGIEVHTGIGGTGVIGRLKVGDGHKVVALRADMDAIALTETGTVSYKSEYEGKMHGCGHDGHVTTVLGAAKLLSEMVPGNVDGTPGPSSRWSSPARSCLRTEPTMRFPATLRFWATAAATPRRCRR